MVLYDEIVNRMNSLADCMTRASEEGYRESFKVIGNRLTTDNEKYFYEPDEVTIDDICGFKGKAIPEDDSIVYLITTLDGRRGILLDAHGPFANTKLAAFVRTVENLDFTVTGKGYPTRVNQHGIPVLELKAQEL